MKIFIQPTQDTPEDFIQADSKDWDSFIGMRPFAISVQGVTFSADWYCVIDRDYGCDVITLDNDIRWYPQPIGNLWQFRHIAPDGNLAYNTDQRRTIYTDKTDIIIPANTRVKPFSDFRKPANSLEGLLVSKTLSDAHTEVQNIRDWREWTENVPDEEIVDGKIRDQTELGRYLKASGTRTYIHRDISRSNGIHTATWEDAFEIATATPATQVGTIVNAGEDAQDWTIVTPSGEPNSGAWPTGDYRLQMDVASAGGNIVYGVLDLDGSAGHFARVNSAITSDLETKQQIEAAQAGTGTKLVTTGSVSWSSGASSDLFECVIAVDFSADHGGAQAVTLNLNVASSFADGPWAAAGGATTPHGPFGLALHGPFGGPI